MPHIFSNRDDCCFVFPTDIAVIVFVLWSALRTAALTGRDRAMAPYVQATNHVVSAIASCFALCGQCRALARTIAGVATFFLAAANTAAVSSYVLPPLEMMAYQLVHLVNLVLVYLFAARWDTDAVVYVGLACAQAASLVVVGCMIASSVFNSLNRLEELTVVELKGH